MSLAVRLAAAFVGLIAVTALALGAAGFVAAERGVSRQVDNFLENRADAIIQGERVGPDGGNGNGNGNGDDDDRRDGRRDNNRGNRGSVDDDSVVQTLAGDGSVDSTTGVLLPVDDTDRQVASGDSKSRRLRTVMIDNGDNYRVLTAALPTGGAIQVARELSESSSAINLIQSQLLPIVAVLALLGAALGLVLAGRITGPLRSLATSVDTVATTGNLNVAIDVEGNDEVGRLASGFQNLLGNLADSRVRQQQLVQDAAHELRTPLTSVKANIDLLALAPDMDPDDRAQTFDSVRSELRELAHLVDEIVDVATDRYTPQDLVELSLGDVVSGAVERFQLRTGRTVETSIAPGVVVNGHRESLDRALANLLSNADKYSPADQPIAVTLTADRQLRVVDRGIGISAEDRQRVFDRFYRADTARSEPGSGLGLSIVKSIVDAHGGSVEITDGADGGTAVTITLRP